MRKLIALSCLLNSMFICASAQINNGINFQKKSSWEAVLAEAKSNNKYIFVDVYTTWCGPCKQMDQEVYPNETVGKFMDSSFISVKIQMDTTENDNDFVKSWRKDAEAIKASAKIVAFPSFLFYAPDGSLIYKSIGSRDTDAFLGMAKFAVDPMRKSFRRDLLDYQNGKKDYEKMVGLAATVRELLGDWTMALQIAKDYKDNYLDKLTINDFLKAENLKFIKDNGDVGLLNTNDQFFRTAYTDPQRIDSILGLGTSNMFVKAIISNTIIKDQLYKDDKPITADPNWRKISKSIISKYPKVDEKQLILNEKVNFYRKIENWNLYSLYRSEQIQSYPPQIEGMGVFYAYNAPAWDVFLKSRDKKALTRALSWSEQSIKLERSPGAIVQYLDTKANLLYKLGRVEEGIECEEQAIKLSEENAKKNNRKKAGFIDEFKSNIEKMKKGEPTWR